MWWNETMRCNTLGRGRAILQEEIGTFKIIQKVIWCKKKDNGNWIIQSFFKQYFNPDVHEATELCLAKTNRQKKIKYLFLRLLLYHYFSGRATTGFVLNIDLMYPSWSLLMFEAEKEKKKKSSDHYYVHDHLNMKWLHFPFLHSKLVGQLHLSAYAQHFPWASATQRQCCLQSQQREENVSISGPILTTFISWAHLKVRPIPACSRNLTSGTVFGPLIWI